jgi:hypothetical protein
VVTTAEGGKQRGRLWVPSGGVAGAASAVRAELQLHAVRALRPVVERVWINPLGATAQGSRRAAATRLLTNAGASRQIAGHFFEHLDAGRYNLRHALDGHVLELRADPLAPRYDASRLIEGRFSGGVQYKLCVDNIGSSISQLNTWKPGSARYATFRVPKDLAAKAARRARSHTRVQASEFSHADIYRQLDQGADQLARYGSWSTNRFFQTAKACGHAAASAVVIGAAIDLLPLLRGHITAEHFAARRGVDALEGASTAAVTSGIVAATMSGATALVSAGGTGAATALAVLTAPAWVVPAAVGVIAIVGVQIAARPIRERIEHRYRTRREQRMRDEQVKRSPLCAPGGIAAAVLWLP